MNVRAAAIAILGSLSIAAGCAASDPAPVQPIAFSHRIHAGDNKIGCTMCHAYAESGPIAGIPSVARCEGCHKFVAADKPEVQKIRAASEAGTPIEWKRVYREPDHVYFTHERHVNAEIACATCHGDVASMDAAKKVNELGMGFCVDCHRERGAPLECITCHK